MKRVLSIISILLLSFLTFWTGVSAETYKRGIVTVASTIKKQASNGANLLNDKGYSMILYSPEAVEIVGEEGDYYLIKYIYSGFIYNGYIPKKNVTAKEYTIDEEYVQELINKGFPNDYARKLAIMHAIHPNWVFTPSFTGRTNGGMDFYTAVRGEASVVDRNLTDYANTSLYSTAPGAYENGVWKTFSGGSWYAVSEQTIAFFLDPRNFMNESNFFMFENQAYNPNVSYKTMVNIALAGSFMANTNPFECFPGANSCTVGFHYYTDALIDAGADKGVNPVNLASRVLKEQGTTGSLLSIGKGYNGQYVGYYNFFNINANGATQADVVLNGLSYAKSRGWNNQRISIIDGAALIGNNYVARGQSTVYYQKFNTITPDIYGHYYGNQYMQNIYAPYSEGYNTYVSYFRSFDNLEEWDNATFDFLIPVYQNMPAYTTLDVTQNSDATLKSLSIPECKFNLAFQSDAYEYECYTPKDTKELNITAEATNGLAKVEYPAKVTLTQDDEVVTIKVTAVNGSTAIYKVNVHRIETDGFTPTEILNGIGLKVTDDLVYNIAAKSDVSNIIKSITNNYHFADVEVTEENGTPIKDGKVKTGQKITITNTGIKKTFTITIMGDATGDGEADILDLLVIQKHIVEVQKLEGAKYKAANLDRNGVVDILDLLLMQKHIVGQYTITQE